MSSINSQTSISSSSDIVTKFASLRKDHEESFFRDQLNEIKNLKTEEVDFKKHSDLPLARIKRIMKGDEDVSMISAEVPVVLGEACKLFIHDVCKQAWFKTSLCKRKNLQRNDLREIIETTEQFDFLIDVFDGTIEAENKERKIREQNEVQAKETEG
mmetsp:Transcript_626/g.756  ORF Transcript_626/g.756 Transcript_626/m.756 type:complete len:157 (+) Transcript_626:192-662(+)|eukprot:CAMPEP_0204829858 /NCGR_PEP_ID=MMETSP1346-20131115/8190_1 /ASSEMBLY_ACC=CAM_ASM_000771 /TAXON_ID=215587 /ORGANISM="Aplanochytrium stocchinoi, Strain GSBS06" /LENGTH=156 /DNA_ID=CAMNT_0051959949 /DNA_START=206 /DNA_END=676 /DNA_ORIENTATION=-